MSVMEQGVRIVHATVPGRLRLAVPGLRRDAGMASRLAAAAGEWPGVRRVTASATTGTLLLEFDPGALQPEELPARIEACLAALAGHPAADSRPSPPSPTAWVPNLLQPPEAGELKPGPVSSPMKERLLLSSPSPSGWERGSGGEGQPAAENRPSPLSASPPSPRPRARALEVAAGAAALAVGGAALVAVAAHGHNLALDRVPLEWAAAVHSPALTALMRGVTRLAEPVVVFPVTALAAAAGVGRQAPGDRAWLAPVAVGGGLGIISLLKLLLRRSRPSAFAPLTPVGGYSLPSGHAFLSMCLYGLLAHHGLRWLRARRPRDRRAAAFLVVAAATAVVLVGVSRVYLGVHYPTDVIAGYLLALVWIFVLAAVNDRPRALSLERRS